MTLGTVPYLRIRLVTNELCSPAKFGMHQLILPLKEPPLSGLKKALRREEEKTFLIFNLWIRLSPAASSGKASIDCLHFLPEKDDYGKAWKCYI